MDDEAEEQGDSKDDERAISTLEALADHFEVRLFSCLLLRESGILKRLADDIHFTKYIVHFLFRTK